ncbi:MAG: hypothetical protein DRN68_03325 [Thaumarchaeota archaeon]|nr:MAG: hypothetical protein DRN68_03325 [Nitrososphaerota archaeon]
MNLVLCHCVLNVNARAPGIALWNGVIDPVYDILKADKLPFAQLPCPEASYLGLRRWWFVKEQYDNALYRDYCREMLIGFSEILLENNIREFNVIGLGISPSCGYRETQSDETWGGRPREIDVTKNVKQGSGVWIEILKEVFKSYGFTFDIYDLPPPLIYPGRRHIGTSKYPRTYEESLNELCEKLGYSYQKPLIEKYPPKEVDADLRSKKILLTSLELALKFDKTLDRYVGDGFGLILIPRSNVMTHERRTLLDAYVRQVENHIKAGHQVFLYESGEGSRLFQEFLKLLEERKLLKVIPRI